MGLMRSQSSFLHRGRCRANFVGIKPGSYCFNDIIFKFEWQPMAPDQTCQRKVWASALHRLSKVVALDIAESIEFAVDEQNRLMKIASARRSTGVADIGGIVQIPSVGWPETAPLKRCDQNLEIGSWPEGRISGGW